MLDGEDMSGLSLFDISKKVGSVFLESTFSIFNVDTTSEIAFGCENHGLEEAEIRKRVKLVSEQLNLTNLLDRSVFSLSGGEKAKNRLWICRRCGTGCICFGRAIFQP